MCNRMPGIGPRLSRASKSIESSYNHDDATLLRFSKLLPSNGIRFLGGVGVQVCSADVGAKDIQIIKSRD
jgi:hypothetical protein